uniref:leucine-rich repeat domain-containing protein n=1 Tax=Microbulbifer agarilyticus TaxID=260552 RepID=UPI0002557F44|nr:leucine-rich repeat domain-containing protein [Microbulbifer agarilyticus]
MDKERANTVKSKQKNIMNRFKKLLSPLAFFSLFVSPVALSTEIEDLTFADANLEACVDERAVEYGWSNIVDATSLDCSYRGITDVTGLSQLTALQELWIHGSELTNYAELANLSSLTDLYVADVSGFDYSVIAALDNLRGLGLQRVGLGNDDLDTVSSYTFFANLETLYLSSNDIGDLSPLGSATSLRILSLTDNPVSDLSPLEGAPLQYLGLFFTQVSDLTPLLGKEISSIEAAGARIKDLPDAVAAGYSDLGAAFPQLTYLMLNGNALQDDDLLKLAEITTLTDVHLENNLFTEGGPEYLALQAAGVNIHGAPLPFVIDQASFIPNDQVNLDEGDQRIDVTVSSTVLDVAFEREETCLYLSSPSRNTQNWYCDSWNASPNGEIWINFAAERGEWDLYAQACGPMGEDYYCFEVSPAHLQAMGFADTSLTVNGTGPGDQTAPVFEGISFTQLDVNIDEASNGYVAVDFDVNFNDGDGTGIQHIELTLRHESHASDTKYVSLPSGISQGKLIFNTIDAAGKWILEYVSASDYAGNYKHIDENQLETLGMQVEFTVTNSNPGPVDIYSLSFADPDLTACVQNEASGNSVSYVHEMYGLWCPERIDDLSGIEQLYMLNYLDLNTNWDQFDPNRSTFSDLSPLAQLSNLHELYFANADVSSIEPLAGLPIRGLNINRNHLTDISAISSMSALQWIDAGENAITFIPDISGLPQLHTISMAHNAITDISPLVGFDNVTGVDLWGNAIPEGDLGLISPSGWYSADWGRPEITSLSIDPSAVDLTNGGVDTAVTFSTADQDNIYSSGVSIHFMPKDTEAHWAWLDGNATEGNLHIPDWASLGEWDLWVEFDHANGFFDIRGPALAAMGFNTSFTTSITVIDPDIDTDGDGLTDEFEIQNGFDPNYAGDAYEDDDNDGFSNLHETMVGTDRGDEFSLPAVMNNPGEGRYLLGNLGNFASNAYVLDLAGDGIGNDDEGRFAKHNGSAHFTWSFANNAISGVNSGSYVNRDDWFVAELGYGTEVEEWVDNISIFEVQSGPNPVWKLVISGRQVYPNESLEDKNFTYVYEHQVMGTGSLTAPSISAGTFTTRVGLGTSFALDPNWVTYPADLVLNGDNTGHFVIPAEVGGSGNQPVTWATEGDGTLVADYAGDSARSTTYFIESFGKGIKTVVIHEFDSAAPGLTGSASARQSMWQEVVINALDASDVVGRLQNAPEGDPSGSSTFALVFNEDGTGHQEFHSNGQWNQSAPFGWEIDGNTVIAHYFRDENWTYYAESDCQGAAECIEYRQRRVVFNDAEDTSGDGENDRFYITIRQGFGYYCDGEICDWQGYVGQFNRGEQDSDGDAIPDDWEVANGLDPYNANDASEDRDGDGADNWTEYAIGTNIDVADTDADGLSDGEEWHNGLDPLNSNLGADQDNDGYLDIHEVKVGTDPYYDGSMPAALADPGTGEFMFANLGRYFNGSVGGLLNLEVDGVSRLSARSTDISGTWTYTGTHLELDLGGYLAFENEVWNNALQTHIQEQTIYDTVYYFAFDQGDGNTTWKEVVVGRLHYPNGELADAGYSSEVDRNVLTAANLYDPGITAGEYATRVFDTSGAVDPNFPFGPSRLSLSADPASSSDSLNGRTDLGWSFDGNGTLSLDYGNGNTAEYRFIEPMGNSRSALAVYHVDGQRFASSVLFHNHANLGLTEQDLVGLYVSDGRDDYYGQPNFGLEFADDGQAYHLYWDGSQWNRYDWSYSWSLQGDTIVAQAWYDTDNWQIFSDASCGGTGVTCVLWRERQFTINDIAGDEVYFTTYQVFDYELDGTFDNNFWSGYVSIFQKNAQVQDSDGDGIPDEWEIANGLDPFTADDAWFDNDNDGLLTIDEYAAGTNPNAADTDADGLSDSDEWNAGLDPLNSNLGADQDSDGFLDIHEIKLGSDPFDAGSTPSALLDPGTGEFMFTNYGGFLNANPGGLLNLELDGTSRLSARATDIFGNWVYHGTHLEVDLGSFLTSDVTAWNNALQANAQVQTYLDTAYFFAVDKGDGHTTWKQVIVGRAHYPNGELPDEGYSSEWDYTVISTAELYNPGVGAGEYATSTLDTSGTVNPAFKLGPTKLTLSASAASSADSLNGRTDLDWSVDGNGVITVDYGNGATTEYRFTEAMGNSRSALAVYFVNGERYAAGTLFHNHMDLGLTEQDIVGQYVYDGREDVTGEPYFGLEFADDGLAYHLSRDTGNWVRSGSPYATYGWTLQGETVVARVWYDTDSNIFATESTCGGSGGNCVVWRERQFTIHDIAGEETYFSNFQVFDNEFDGTFENNFWSGYVSIFQKIVPPSDFDNDGIIDEEDLDDDNDGLTDQFEIDNGLNPQDATDADGDNDSDGFSNLHEAVVGTDMNDGGSVPLAMANPGAGRFLLTNEGGYFNASSGYVIDLEGDGIGADDLGRMAFADGSSAFTWEYANNSVSATSDGNYVNRDSWWVNEIGAVDEIERHVEKLHFFLSTEDGEFPTWKVVAVGYRSYVSGQLADEPFVDVYDAHMVGGGSVSGDAPAITSGVYASGFALSEFYNIAPTTLFVSTAIGLNNDGSGEVEVMPEISGDGDIYINWMVDSDGSLILEDQNSNARTTFYFVETFGKATKTVVFHEYDTSAGIAGRAAANDSMWEQEQTGSLTHEDVIGTFIDVAESSNSGVPSFGLQFAPDGVGSQGYYDVNDGYFPGSPFAWYLDGNRVVIEYYADESGNRFDEASCGGAAVCTMYRKRLFIVHDREDQDEDGYDDRHYVSIRQAFDRCGGLCDWQGYVSQFDRLTDADNDSLPDAWEAANGLNPTDGGDAFGDNDGDTLDNVTEFTLGTSPTSVDTDNDGMRDNLEQNAGLNPLDAGDALQDPDADGYNNYEEVAAGTDINDIGDFPAGEMYYSLGVESTIIWGAGVSWAAQDNGQDWNYRSFAAFGDNPLFIDMNGTQTMRADTAGDYQVAERFIDVTGTDGVFVSTFYGTTGCPAGEEDCVSQIDFDGNFWSRSDGSEGVATSDRGLIFNSELVEGGDQARYTWTTFRIKKPDTLTLADINGVWHISNWGREFERDGTFTEGHYIGNGDWQFNGDGTCQQVTPFEYQDAWAYFDGQNLASQGVSGESGQDSLEACSYTVDPIQGRVFVDLKLSGDDENSEVELKVDASKQRMVSVYMDDEEWGAGAGMVMLVKKGDASAYASNAALNGTVLMNGDLSFLDWGNGDGSSARSTGGRIARLVIDFDGNGTTDGEGYSSCTLQRVEKFQGHALWGSIGIDAGQNPWQWSSVSYPSQCRYRVNTDGTVELEQGEPGGLVNTTFQLDANGELLTTTYIGNGYSELLMGVVLENVVDPIAASERFVDYGFYDTDGDGLPDSFEIAYALDLNGDDSASDLDDDGLSNLEESEAGTNPRSADTDGDGMGDAYELANNLDPTVDDGAADADDDGATNLEEFEAGTDPWNPASKPRSGTIKNDFDGDGDSDLFLREVLGGSWRMFELDNGSVVNSAYIALYANLNWEFQAAGDFDGDGDSDVLMRDVVAGSWRIFELEDGGITSTSYISLFANLAWEFKASGDFDGDGDADVLMRHSESGSWRLFEFQNGNVISKSYISLYANLELSLKAAGDIDGDGDTDVLMRNSVDGRWWLFEVESGNVVRTASIPLFAAPNWQLQATGDFDGDGDSDVLLRDADSGSWRLFTMTNGGVDSPIYIPLYASLAWQLQAAGDFDGDGDADLLMRSTQDGSWRAFEVEDGGIVMTSYIALFANLNWEARY